MVIYAEDRSSDTLFELGEPGLHDPCLPHTPDLEHPDDEVQLVPQAIPTVEGRPDLLALLQLGRAGRGSG